MHVRVLSIAAAIVAVYLVFGDAFMSSKTKSPENFVNDLGRGIGQMVSGVGDRLSQLIWG